MRRLRRSSLRPVAAGRALEASLRGLLIACALAGLAGRAHAQLRVSPGPLARAHAGLEGVGNCSRCHDSVQGVSAPRCLACHRPIAARIAAKAGVHRAVTGNCGRCHVEHAGVGADLRRLDTAAFDHAAETGFALDGEHGKLAARCAACHKKRTYLAARRACGSCHADAHRGTLGTTCPDCHSTGVPFKQTRHQFDHARARFSLTGAHRAVACEKCHTGGVFRGLRFDGCGACHKPPHRRALAAACTECHTPDRWATRALDSESHGRTGFTLAGAHNRVACAKCHPSGIRTRLRYDRCSACHADVHRQSVKEDCRACHTETGFKGATFDHGARTPFALAGRHAGLACRKCHTALSAEEVPLARKVLDFGGLRAACVACHKDQHKGEFGAICDACHRPTTFKAAGFVHPRAPEFFAGRHQGVACVKCHVRAAGAQPAGPVAVPSMGCTACHTDVHLGQVGTACDRCHAVNAARFAPARFSHETAGFPLTGRHRNVECVKCHPRETGVFPAGNGTAMRLKPRGRDCHECHKDPHMGQVDRPCATCHTTATFDVAAYAHPGQEYTFSVASHDRLPCRSCHRLETRQFPAGWGTAIRLKVGRACVDCHR